MTSVRTKVAVKTESAVDSISKLSMGVLATVSAVGGFWAIACLVGAFVSSGPAEVLKGFVTAVAG